MLLLTVHSSSLPSLPWHSYTYRNDNASAADSQSGICKYIPIDRALIFGKLLASMHNFSNNNNKPHTQTQGSENISEEGLEKNVALRGCRRGLWTRVFRTWQDHCIHNSPQLWLLHQDLAEIFWACQYFIMRKRNAHEALAHSEKSLLLVN